jgi:ribosomal protein S18 acetylase RimI-like enzyme
MLPIDIRKGTAEDAPLITDLIKAMVVDMALYGGDAVNLAPEVWSAWAEQVRVSCGRPDHIYLIASHGSPLQKTPAGLVAAYINPLEDIFTAKTRLHLSTVYTLPAVRRQGVARQLIEKALAWGRQMKAEEADLNVLAANPARRLYEGLGFQAHEISMIMKFGGEDRINGKA